MPHHFGTVDRPAWCGPPSALQSRVEQFVCGWLVIPHGDREKTAESGGIENEKDAAPAQDNIVRIFVLDHNVQEGPRRCGEGHLNSVF
jgi:hypothetical protein